MARPPAFKLKTVEEQLDTWTQNCASFTEQAEKAPTRYNMAALLTYVRDNKLVGTQATGNMPLKAVAQVAALFIDPPQLEQKIGEKVFKPRNEQEVWPVYFLHILAEVGGLIKMGRARRWTLMTQANRLLETPTTVQAAFLLGIWWHRTNWVVAYPYSGMGDQLPFSFTMTTLIELLSLPIDTAVPFEEFADDLIHKTRLTWGAQDSQFANMALRGAIQRMIIHVLADFGALERSYRTEPLGNSTTKRLDTFKITPWGNALLESVSHTAG